MDCMMGTAITEISCLERVRIVLAAGLPDALNI